MYRYVSIHMYVYIITAYFLTLDESNAAYYSKYRLNYSKVVNMSVL